MRAFLKDKDITSLYIVKLDKEQKFHDPSSACNMFLSALRSKVKISSASGESHNSQKLSQCFEYNLFLISRCNELAFLTKACRVKDIQRGSQ